MTFSFRRVYPDAILPTRKHQLDAGIDFYSYEDKCIEPWRQVVIDTGVDLAELPELPKQSAWDSLVQEASGNVWKSVLQIWPKSGLDSKVGLHTGAGVIDYLYRGRVLILVKNQSDHNIVICKGDPIAQGVIVPCYVGEVTEVAKTNETERGASGGIASALKGAGGTTENFKA